MDTYSPKISGPSAARADAENALGALLERAVPRERVQIFDSSSPTSQPVPKEDSNAALRDVQGDGTMGTAVGAGLA